MKDASVYLVFASNKGGIGGNTQRIPNETKRRKMMGMIMSAGSREINKYHHGTILWKSMVAPHCLYDSEIIQYRRGPKRIRGYTKLYWETVLS